MVLISQELKRNIMAAVNDEKIMKKSNAYGKRLSTDYPTIMKKFFVTFFFKKIFAGALRQNIQLKRFSLLRAGIYTLKFLQVAQGKGLGGGKNFLALRAGFKYGTI